jgi:hypothetical protein
MVSRNDLRALRLMINEARIILNTTKLPEGRAECVRELLESAVAFTDELIARPTFAVRASTKKAKV